MEEFYDVLRNYRKLGVWAVGGAAGIPFVSGLIGMEPPSPSGIVVITAIFQFIVIMFIFQSRQNSSKRSVTKHMLISLLAFVVLILVYVFYYQLFVIPVPRDQRIVAGFTCTIEATKIYSEICPFLRIDQLEDVAFRETKLWTPISLALSNFLLIFIWSAAFLNLSWSVASFLVYQSTGKQKKSPAST